MADPIPITVLDYVIRQLAALDRAARLAVVLDPFGELALGDKVEAGDRTWQVTRYDGNDLAFRQSYQPGPRDLVWVTCTPGIDREEPPRLQLRSLVDVWRRADGFVDASLPGVLRQLVPNETWPAESVWGQAEILGQNLHRVVSGIKTLRRYLSRGASLDAHAVRALALGCLQPGLPIQDFLFQQDTAPGVLDAYVRLLWQAPWNKAGMTLLQVQAREAPRLEMASAMAWLEAPPDGLAVYLYLRRLFSHYRVRSIANQLRGLGLLDFDPEALEPWAESVLTRWDRQPEWRQQIVRQAEERLQEDDLRRIAGVLNLESPDEAVEALLRAETPAAIYALGVHAFQLAFEHKKLTRFTSRWAERQPTALTRLPETPFAPGAVTLASLFDELSIINRLRQESVPAEADLATLLDWYVEKGIYDLEYAHARASNQALYLSNGALRKRVERYLKFLQKELRTYLEEADQALARWIEADWPRYVGHPRLSTHVLWDTIIKRRLTLTSETCAWIVIFDGMRWDTWARHVRPRLLERFELVAPEKAYVCLLPSWTGVARTGLLSGKPPAGWRSYEGRYTTDQEQLVAKLLDLPQRTRDRSLRFYSGMESDRKYCLLDPNARVAYNVLIYNLSDDNLHSQRGDLLSLNRTVDTLLDQVFQMLDNLVQAGDTVIVSSDHGFVELAEGKETTIPDQERWQRYREGGAHPVRYRYALTHELPKLDSILRVEYPGSRDQYTVAVGQHWFKRADWRGRTDRYAHGGLSLAEMVVPGAVLKRIAEPRIEMSLAAEPGALQLDENQVATLTIRVANQGNVRATAMLEVQADTAPEKIAFAVDLGPGSKQEFSYPVEAVYRKRSDGTTESTSQVSLKLSYTDLEGKAITRRKRVPVEVQPRYDVVEIDFGGLDDLDI